MVARCETSGTRNVICTRPEGAHRISGRGSLLVHTRGGDRLQRSCQWLPSWCAFSAKKPEVFKHLPRKLRPPAKQISRSFRLNSTKLVHSDKLFMSIHVNSWLNISVNACHKLSPAGVYEPATTIAQELQPKLIEKWTTLMLLGGTSEWLSRKKN